MPPARVWRVTTFAASGAVSLPAVRLYGGTGGASPSCKTKRLPAHPCRGSRANRIPKRLPAPGARTSDTMVNSTRHNPQTPRRATESCTQLEVWRDWSYGGDRCRCPLTEHRLGTARGDERRPSARLTAGPLLARVTSQRNTLTRVTSATCSTALVTEVQAASLQQHQQQKREILEEDESRPLTQTTHGQPGIQTAQRSQFAETDPEKRHSAYVSAAVPCGSPVRGSERRPPPLSAPSVGELSSFSPRRRAASETSGETTSEPKTTRPYENPTTHRRAGKKTSNHRSPPRRRLSSPAALSHLDPTCRP
ncbi:uncharacterized protein LOC116951124 isoform X4 [Petromyzon marinus]|uniref:uncharacterized protein LOC116951124 isoform X4 n=1 Tax=Petromyzon marinus TaxID=7757 RepID=UPI003F6F687B